MIEYRTKDGDRLDQICYKHYGNLGVVEQVLDANPQLAAMPVIPAGILVKLPDIEQPTEFDDAGESVWG